MNIRYVTPAINYMRFLLYDHLMIEPTTRCNLSCQTCTRRSMPVSDIATDTLMGILHKHRNIGSVCLNGLGESLMHPDITGLAMIARKHTKDVWLVTNGTIMNRELAEVLSHITISLDTLDFDKAKEIKGKGYRLETVLWNIRKYATLLPTTVNFTRTARNHYEAHDIAAYCNSVGATFNLTRVQNWSVKGECEFMQSFRIVREEREMFGEIPHRQYLCHWRWGRAYYYRLDGTRNPCCRRLNHATYDMNTCCRDCPD